MRLLNFTVKWGMFIILLPIIIAATLSSAAIVLVVAPCLYAIIVFNGHKDGKELIETLAATPLMIGFVYIGTFFDIKE